MSRQHLLLLFLCLIVFQRQSSAAIITLNMIQGNVNNNFAEFDPDELDFDNGDYFEEEIVEDLDDYYYEEEFEVIMDYEDGGLQLNIGGSGFGRIGIAFNTAVLTGNYPNSSNITLPMKITSIGSPIVPSPLKPNHQKYEWNESPVNNLIELNAFEDFGYLYGTPQSPAIARTARIRYGFKPIVGSLAGFNPKGFKLTGEWNYAGIGDPFYFGLDVFRIRPGGSAIAAVPEPNSFTIAALPIIAFALRSAVKRKRI